MKILIEESVLRQALEALELAEYHLTPNINVASKMQKPILEIRSALYLTGTGQVNQEWVSSLEKLINSVPPLEKLGADKTGEK